MSMMTFLSIIYSSFTSMSQIFQHLCRSDTVTLVAQKWSQTLDKNLSIHFDYQYDISTVVQDFLFTLAQLQT